MDSNDVIDTIVEPWGPMPEVTYEVMRCRIDLQYSGHKVVYRHDDPSGLIATVYRRLMTREELIERWSWMS